MHYLICLSSLFLQPVIRLYDIPDNTFESDDEDGDDDDDDELVLGSGTCFFTVSKGFTANSMLNL